MTTTNFNDWMDNLQETDIETIYCLYESITSSSEVGAFKTSTNNGRKFVQSELNDETLMLSTKTAETGFLKKLDYEYGGDFGTVYGSYEFDRAMSKDD